jgi:hypothetical protein
LGAWLCLPLKVALFFLFIYIYINLFPIETIIGNASKGGKANRKPRKPYHPIVTEIYTKQSTNEENSSLIMNRIL